MQTIYEKIDAIFADELNNPPIWATELLQELQELKILVKEEKKKNYKRDRKFYAFLKEFRRSMRADVDKNLYPKIIDYKNRKLGVNFDGLLYDVKSSNLLPTKEAFKVYGYLYKKKNFEIFY